jgi:DNA-directed RNA polymerase subunit L
MEPVVSNISASNKNLTFTLSGVNHSIANAIRRTIMSDIPTVIFRTTPYADNKASFVKNSTKYHNEILKNRLSNIPVHFKMSNLDEFYNIEISYIDNLLKTKKILENYLLEVNVNNTTDSMVTVSTGDFKIFDKEANKHIPQEETKLIFPPFIPYNRNTEYYITFVKLNPKISDEILGEAIHFSAEFGYGSCKEDGSFSVASMAVYGNTIDEERSEDVLKELKAEWSSTMTTDEVEKEAVNWKLLEKKRIYLPNSFDFKIETIGVYQAERLVTKSCEILIERLYLLNYVIDANLLEIVVSKNISENSYDVILKADDYTIGSMIQYVLYVSYYPSVLNYCGYKKIHPDDSHSVIRLGYSEETTMETIKEQIKTSIVLLVDVFQKIRKSFLPDEEPFYIQPTEDWDTVMNLYYR